MQQAIFGSADQKFGFSICSDDFFQCLNDSSTSTPIVATPSSPASISAAAATPMTTSYYRTPSPAFPTRRPSSETVQDLGVGSSPIDVDDDNGSSIVRGIAIGFAAVALISIAAFSFAFYRRTRINRFVCFILTGGSTIDS